MFNLMLGLICKNFLFPSFYTKNIGERVDKCTLTFLYDASL